MLCASVKTKVSNVQFNQCKKEKGRQGTCQGFIPRSLIFPSVRTSAIRAGQRRRLLREGLTFTRITAALSVKVSSWCKSSETASCYTVKALSRWCSLWQPWPWSCLIFWGFKVTLKTKETLIWGWNREASTCSLGAQGWSQRKTVLWNSHVKSLL